MPPKGYRKPTEEGVNVIEEWSIASVPKPWKSPLYAAKNASRRNKTVKQILALERDRAMGRQPGEKRAAAGKSAQVSREVSVAMDVDGASVNGEACHYV
jgi:hypothetical protein